MKYLFTKNSLKIGFVAFRSIKLLKCDQKLQRNYLKVIKTLLSWENFLFPKCPGDIIVEI